MTLLWLKNENQSKPFFLVLLRPKNNVDKKALCTQLIFNPCRIIITIQFMRDVTNQFRRTD